MHSRGDEFSLQTCGRQSMKRQNCCLTLLQPIMSSIQKLMFCVSIFIAYTSVMNVVVAVFNWVGSAKCEYVLDEGGDPIVMKLVLTPNCSKLHAIELYFHSLCLSSSFLVCCYDSSGCIPVPLLSISALPLLPLCLSIACTTRSLTYSHLHSRDCQLEILLLATVAAFCLSSSRLCICLLLVFAY